MRIFSRRSERFERKLQKKEGMTSREAALVAGTEIDGIPIEKDGSYQDRRTACHEVGRRGGQWRCRRLDLLSPEDRKRADEVLRNC